jgi:hypothetical protein
VVVSFIIWRFCWASSNRNEMIMALARHVASDVPPRQFDVDFLFLGYDLKG